MFGPASIKIVAMSAAVVLLLSVASLLTAYLIFPGVFTPPQSQAPASGSESQSTPSSGFEWPSFSQPSGQDLPAGGGGGGGGGQPSGQTQAQQAGGPGAAVALTQSQPDSNVYTMLYDNSVKLINLTNDALGRVLTKTAEGVNIAYTYDEQYNGTLSSVTADGMQYDYEYDDRGRMTKETRTIDGIAFVRAFTYDSTDRVTSEVLSPGAATSYAYDGRGLVDAIAGFVTGTDYNAAGSPASRTYANALATQYSYDAATQRLLEIRTGTLQRLGYTYDAAGNVLSIDDSVNGRTYEMVYDFLDRMVKAVINSDTYTYDYSPTGSIVELTRNGFSTRFSYGIGPAHAPYRIDSDAPLTTTTTTTTTVPTTTTTTTTTAPTTTTTTTTTVPTTTTTTTTIPPTTTTTTTTIPPGPAPPGPVPPTTTTSITTTTTTTTTTTQPTTTTTTTTIPVPTTTTTVCSCTAWANVGCGEGGCDETKMYKTRTCTPSGCAVQTQCVSSTACQFTTTTSTTTTTTKPACPYGCADTPMLCALDGGTCQSGYSCSIGSCCCKTA